ncbi:cytidine and dCMP deaminase domain-containing protein 1-like [Montipora foliosa]|uniref:cytidine and dCMP deaminase domain-containing protein 1-like n=1 Tax=Montipora foliosa TaxID=591990 RepID=UPI0035F176D9
MMSVQKGKVSTSYASRYSRLTKDNLYMILALWMEGFPEDQPDKKHPYKKVGAVLVLPNDRIYAVDCSLNGVHAVARLLMKHNDVLQKCKVFVSRKPCSFCTKLLVQSKVERVFYLPLEPEYFQLNDREFEKETSRVDNLFKVSQISQSVFVPEAGDDVIKAVQARFRTPKKIRDKIAEDLMKTHWSKNWMAVAKKKLPWPSLDKKMTVQIESDFDRIMRWIASILVGSYKGYKFELVPFEGDHQPISFNPAAWERERQQSYRLITLAKFLAERSDDPKTGVGAVIMNKKKEIVGLGWNGFPAKALYGEFPRASDKDKGVPDRKYPYIVHAEQNALLMRNTNNIEGGILFVTKTPCDECTTLLEMLGIETVILGAEFVDQKTKKGISYNKFYDGVKSGRFTCFCLVSERSRVKRNLHEESENQGSKRARKTC